MPVVDGGTTFGITAIRRMDVAVTAEVVALLLQATDITLRKAMVCPAGEHQRQERQQLEMPRKLPPFAAIIFAVNRFLALVCAPHLYPALA